jgi:hypothetical protein
MPGVRVNLSSKGVGASVGVPGFRKGISATGKSYSTVSIPGTGLSNTTYEGRNQARGKSTIGTVIGSVVLILFVIWVLSAIFG